MDKNWGYKTVLLKALKAQLEKHRWRDDRFEGISQRRESFRQTYPKADCFGPRSLQVLDPKAQERLFQEEAFCGFLGVVELDCEGVEDYLQKATRFCNEKLWGDLSCLVVVDPKTRRRYERSIAHCLTLLEYGTVGVNVYPGLAFVSNVTPWGSYLDGKADTGNGWVHNTSFFFDRPEKTVMEGFLYPPHSSTLGQALSQLESARRPLSLSSISIRAVGLWRNS